MVVRILALIALLLASNSAFAGTKGSIQRLVKINPNKSLYVNYTPPTAGKPTLVILNGLTYTVENWDSFVSELDGEGFGILRYDMTGMGRTLLAGNLPVDYKISWMSQVKELAQLLSVLKIKKAHILGLSYGGGIAAAFANTYPNLVESVIMMAPFTEPLAGQDSLIRYQMATFRSTYPWIEMSDDDLYDYFLKQMVYTVYPTTGIVVIDNPYTLEAMFRLVQGIRHLTVLEHMKNIPAKSLHLVMALQDQFVAPSVLDKFWNDVDKTQKASRINIMGSEHRIPEFVPAFSAAWVKEILKGNKHLSKGLTFEGNIFSKNATSGKIEIDLSKR